MGSSLTGLAILLSRGRGVLYEFAHPGEKIFVLAPLGLFLMFVALLRHGGEPRGWIWLILAAVPIGLVVGTLGYIVVESVRWYLIGWSCYGAAWIGLGATWLRMTTDSESRTLSALGHQT